VPADIRKGSLFLADYARIVTELSVENPDAADRFCDAIERALALLCAHPEIGAKAGFRHAPKVRKWIVQPFRNYLLFYEARPEGVVFIRLLHGARDLPPLIPPS
jgi:plasmid stabilization system protein ParE